MSEEVIPPPTVVEQEEDARAPAGIELGSEYKAIRVSVLRSGRLYEDPYFLPVDDNIFHTQRLPRPFVWKRPSEICKDPKFLPAKASRFDIQQGKLGNCWFLAAMNSITLIPSILYKVVPRNQSFESGYCGAFCFRFWVEGKWVEVVVDDRLPTYNNKLVFVHSEDGTVFWAALLEKAYAKLNGSYESLKGGQTSEAMTDLTGGLVESYDLGSKAPKDLFQRMLKYHDRSSPMGCSINAKPNEIQAKLDNGLVMGLAYAVTGVRKVKARTRMGKLDVELVRIRIPWGNEREWNGAWSDKSPEWTLLSDDEKQKMGLTFNDDGEFWMAYRDFISNFQRLEICFVAMRYTFLEDGVRSWDMAIHKDRWCVGSTAGGCRNNPNTFYRNPQFRVLLEDTDDEDDMCTMIVALMQTNRRKLRRKLGANSNLTIGFAIYKVPDKEKDKASLDKDFFLYHASSARSNTFINSREIVNRFKLPPGLYCIVPSTFDANEAGDFVLRVLMESPRSEGTAESLSAATGTQAEKERAIASSDPRMDAKYKAFFDKCAGSDGQIDSFELKNVLEAAFSKDISDQDFNLETCRSLISLEDENGTGKLEFKEFKECLVKVKRWHAEFKKVDADRSGSLDMYELQDLLKNAGIANLPLRDLTALTARYSNKRGTVDFDDCIQILVRLCVIKRIAAMGLPKSESEFIEAMLPTC